MLALPTKMKNSLKAKAHHLKPVITIGNNGVTENVIAETERALYDHELIKVKIHSNEKAERVEIIEDICNQTNAANINLVGKIGTIYKPSTKNS